MSDLGQYNYWVSIALMMIGFYGVLARRNLIKKIIALGLFQTGIFLLFITMAVVRDRGAPIHVSIDEGLSQVVNPVPHVLILTAIVVSISVSAVALGVTVLIHRAYGTIEADDIDRLDREQE